MAEFDYNYGLAQPVTVSGAGMISVSVSVTVSNGNVKVNGHSNIMCNNVSIFESYQFAGHQLDTGSVLTGKHMDMDIDVTKYQVANNQIATSSGATLTCVVSILDSAGTVLGSYSLTDSPNPESNSIFNYLFLFN